MVGGWGLWFVVCVEAEPPSPVACLGLLPFLHAVFNFLGLEFPVLALRLFCCLAQAAQPSLFLSVEENVCRQPLVLAATDQLVLPWFLQHCPGDFDMADIHLQISAAALPSHNSWL